MPLGLFHYNLLHEVIESVHLILDEGKMADAILKAMSETLEAEAGTIFRVAPNGGISAVASFGAPVEVLNRLHFEVGKGVVGWVAEEGKPVLVADPAKDRRFSADADKTTGFKTRGIIAAPVMARGRVIGVIEFLNRKNSQNFTEQDLDLIAMVGREIGIVFDNVRLVQRLEASLEFSSSLIDSLPVGILVFDQNLRFLRSNAIAERLLGLSLPRENPVPPAIDSVLALFPALAAAAHRMVVSDEPLAKTEVALTIAGKAASLGWSGFPIANRQGRRWGSALLLHGG